MPGSRIVRRGAPGGRADVLLAGGSSQRRPRDELPAVTRELLCPAVSRSGLDRCLRRHRLGNLRLRQPLAEKATHAVFKSYRPGYLHRDIKCLPQIGAGFSSVLAAWLDEADRRVDAALLGVESAAHGQTAPAVGRHAGETRKMAGKSIQSSPAVLQCDI